MKLAPLVLSTGLVLSVLQGCAPADDDAAGADSAAMSTRGVRFTNETINVDQTFSNTARVEDDRIVVPKDVNRAVLLKIRQGAVLAGNRDMRTTDLARSGNPYGFLRRVTQMAPDGENMIILTEHAELSEWIGEGRLNFNDPKAFPFQTDINPLDIQPLDTGGQNAGSGAGTAPLDSGREGPEMESPDKKFKYKPIVKLAKASFKLNVQHDGYFDVHTTLGVPRSIDYRSHLVFDPVVSADITAGIVVGGELANSENLRADLPVWEQTWELPSILIPLGAAPVTARFTPEVYCKIKAGGSLEATVHAEVRAHGAVGFEGRATWGTFDWRNLSEKPSLNPSLRFVGIQGKASMVAECTVSAIARVMLFDAAGVEGKVGPRVSLNANACATYDAERRQVGTDFNLFEQHELVVAFGGRVQVPGLALGKTFPIDTSALAKSGANYLLGDAETCR